MTRIYAWREIKRWVLIVYLEEIRFLHCVFERVEVVKMLWQREGYGMRWLLYSPMLLLLSHCQHIIIKGVRIWDYCLTYSSLAAALQALREWTCRRLDPCSEEQLKKIKRRISTKRKKEKKRRGKKKAYFFKEKRGDHAMPFLFVSFAHTLLLLVSLFDIWKSLKLHKESQKSK